MSSFFKTYEHYYRKIPAEAIVNEDVKFVIRESYEPPLREG
jgi:hypothetical protein